MADFTGAFSVTQSDKTFSLPKEGVEGYCYAPDDTSTWGEALKESDGKLQFSQKYLNFTFVIKRENIGNLSEAGDFQGPSSATLKLWGNNGKNGTQVLTIYNDASWTNSIYGSRSGIVSNPDSAAYVRIQVPTSLIYNIGKIEKIYCEVKYNWKGSHKIEHTWDLLNGTTVHKGHYWKVKKVLGVSVSESSENNGQYGSSIIAPISSYTGHSQLYSVTTEGSTDKFFTEDQGNIHFYFYNTNFFSSDEAKWRVPTTAFFEGKNKNDINTIQSIDFFDKVNGSYPDLLDVGKNPSRDYDISTDKLSSFKEINKIYISFGGDHINKFCIFDKKMKNIDIDENINFVFTKSSNNNNKLFSIEKNSIKLKSELIGTISKEDDDLLELQSDFQIVYKKNDKDEIVKDIIKDSSTISFSEIYTAEVKSGKLNIYDFKNDKGETIEGNCPTPTGTYLLRCKIKNKLRNENIYFRDFEVKNLEFTNNSEKVVALKGPSVSIKYDSTSGDTYDVPGDIIIKDEYLDFSAEDFKFYNLSDGSENITPYSHYIGISSIEQYSLISEENCSDQDLTSNNKFKYEDLKGIAEDTINYYENETNKPFISYLFKNGETFSNEVHTYTFSYTLGRVEDPQIKTLDTIKNGLKFFLTDNGGDIKHSRGNINGISQNNYIQNRIPPLGQPTQYFSLSRQPKEGNEAQEELFITITYGSGTETEETEEKTYSVRNDESKLLNLLNLLKTGTNNELSFSELGMLDSDLTSILEKRPLTVEIELRYIYENENGNELHVPLFTITKENLSFIQEELPFGLRKGGAIVNPEFNEPLNKPDSERENTFVINVQGIEIKNSKYTSKNGLRIVFDSKEETPPFFDIYLDDEGKICFASKEGIFKPTFSQNLTSS